MLALDENGQLRCARGGFTIDADNTVVGETGAVTVSFHPSGFAPGAQQVRLEADGEVWVVTGDFNRQPDPLAPPFEVVPCDVLVTGSLFALPIYRWDARDDLAAWLEANESAALFASPVLALRLQAQLATPLRRHEDLEPLVARYEALGVKVKPSDPTSKRLLVPVASREKVKRTGPTALAAGTARIRGTRRRSNFDTGFALSEHADWAEILRTVEETRARRVLVRGPHAAVLARFLREERGLASEVLG